MPVPLALAAPAAAASLAYINAKTSFFYDYSVLGAALKGVVSTRLREKKDRLSPFYDIEQHAQGKLADKTLLFFEGRQWTYKAVYQTALKYGTWLKTKYHIMPKEIVAIDFMNSEHFVFIWLGLWSIGAKPAFINYNLTDKALAHCIRISTARVVFVDPLVQHNATQDVRDELPNVQFEFFTPQLEVEAMTTEGVREPDTTRSEDKSTNMAILIYTSGTTGLPKGAIVSWQKVLALAKLVPNWSSLNQNDVFYTCMPMYHSSAALLGFCTVAISGGTLALGRKFSTKTFWTDCRSMDATVIQYVGETCRYLLSAPTEIDPATGQNLDKKNSVRLAFGNGLRPDIWNKFKERFGITEIAEFYAATEGMKGSWNFSRNDFSTGAIGRVGTLLKVLSRKTIVLVELDLETEQPWRDPKTGCCKRVEPGQPGEQLYKLDPDDISASYQGYFNNPSSSKSKLMHNVFEKGDVWFRTGDLLISDSEGRTFFNDRIGDTYRWKAENVSTNEVSEALGHHASVTEANVYGVELPHHDGRAGCVAIVLADEPSEKLMQDLALHVHERLPKFAVPVFLRITKDMQMTGTNKQQKHVIRAQGVDPGKTGGDEFYWLKGGSYVKFGPGDWDELNGGRVKL
ncbi:Fatty acid transporter protein [Lachnellula occidentalis]|uniref:Very long-chain fatty acid transport protein n=1 Tax=Lachnellula occidentalis TaxID=215460 RepID=A0A8H8RBR8_9HELO|nr:Fatty acid transporter protein [Lachnellula occidentalis]